MKVFLHPALVAIGLLLTTCTATTATDPVLLESVRWYTGETGRVDDTRARTLLEAAARDNDVLSIMWLARVYSTGRMTFPADKARAVEIATSVIAAVEQLALAGNAEAEFLMGTAYAEGLGKPVDAPTAITWYRRAAAQGHTLALHNIGNMYAAGTGVPQSDIDAVQWWLLAAAKGDAIPQLRLGEMYEQGRGVSRDLKQAEHWYGQAAARGNSNAAAALERLRQGNQGDGGFKL